MERVIRRAVTFGVAGFAFLLALHLAALRWPASLPPPDSRIGYAFFYVGFTSAVAAPIFMTIILGMAGSAFGFWLVPRSNNLRAWAIPAAGAMFALVAFFLDASATQSAGELLRPIVLVAIGGLLGYTAGRVFSRNAA
jgi:hypothetical protein